MNVHFLSLSWIALLLFGLGLERKEKKEVGMNQKIGP